MSQVIPKHPSNAELARGLLLGWLPEEIPHIRQCHACQDFILARWGDGGPHPLVITQLLANPKDSLYRLAIAAYSQRQEPLPIHRKLAAATAEPGYLFEKTLPFLGREVVLQAGAPAEARQIFLFGMPGEDMLDSARVVFSTGNPGEEFTVDLDNPQEFGSEKRLQGALDAAQDRQLVDWYEKNILKCRMILIS